MLHFFYHQRGAHLKHLLKWTLALIGVGLGFSIIGIKFACLNTAIALIHEDLKEPLSNLQWIMTIFGIVMSSTLVTMGRIADLCGRKRLFLIALIGLLITQLGAGLSPNLTWILVFQTGFGLCGGIVLPVSQALMISLFPPEQKSKAIGIWTAISGIAIGSGPLLAGALVHSFGWRGSFLINIPLASISFLLVLFAVPKSPPPQKKVTIDWAAMVLILFFVAPFILATNKRSEWPLPSILALYGIAALSLSLLIIVEKRTENPILYTSLFRNRRFLSAAISNFFFVSFCWAIFFVIPFYLQTVKHLSPLSTGFMMLAATFTMSFISPFSKHTRNASLGFLFLVFCALHLFFLRTETSLYFLFTLLLCYGIGWGLLWNPIISTALSALPPEKTATTSGTYITLQELGGSIGLALTGTLLNTKSSFLAGLHVAAYLLLAFCLCGLLATYFLPHTKKAPQPLKQ